LAKEQSNISGIDRSDDIDATERALAEMGAGAQNVVINCKESGSTLRFLIPVAAALGISAVFTGEGRLPERPVNLYADLFCGKGVDVNFCADGKIPVNISGKLSPGKFFVPGDVSSQFITGLMFALPLLDGDSEIILTSPLQSAPYADITAGVLQSFGVSAHKTANGYYIPGSQRYTGADYTVEGDFSQAAFFAVAAAVNGDIKIERLNPQSLQGDYKIIDILRGSGAGIYFEGDILRAAKRGNLTGMKIDASQIPDLIPVLSVAAAYAQGETIIYNAGRLRLKESDRIKSVCGMLAAIGAKSEETNDGMIIFGTGGAKLPGGFVESRGDHRIAMSAAVASVWTENGVTVDDMGCVKKSYPGFLRDFTGLGL